MANFSKKRKSAGASSEATAYEVLGVAPSIADSDLRRQVQQMLLATHPDSVEAADRKLHAQCAFGKPHPRCRICKFTRRFQQITAAYAQLGNGSAARRRVYDSVLRLRGATCDKCRGAGRITVYKGFFPNGTLPCSECDGTGTKRGSDKECC